MTLINCSLCNKPCQNKIKIVLCLHPDTPADLVKSLISIDGVRLLKKISSWSCYSQLESEVKNYISDNYSHPPSVKVLFSKPSTSECDRQLTPRQHQIATLISDSGLSNKEIAKTLSISLSTVKLHVSVLFKKFNIARRTQLAAKYKPTLK